MKAIRVLASAAAVGLVSCSAFALFGWAVHERAVLRMEGPSDAIELDACAPVEKQKSDMVEVAYREQLHPLSVSNGHHIMRVEGDTGQTY